MLSFSRGLRRPHNLLAVSVINVITEAMAGAIAEVAETKLWDAAAVFLEFKKYLGDIKVAHSINDQKFVPRPEIEDEIKEAIFCDEPSGYTIVYGAKGVGKSSLVERVAKDKKAVVLVSVGSTDNMNSITALIMSTVTRQSVSLNKKVLNDALMNFNLVTNIVPTLIFDVECGSEADAQGSTHKGILQEVRSLAKELHEVCNCVIVVSETNAVLQFGKDERENFIYVGEMSLEETKEFVKLRGFKLSDEEVQKIYENIGGNPTSINKLFRIKKKLSLDAHIRASVGLARKELVAFKLKPILKALKEHPEGIDPEDFNNQEYKGIDMTSAKKVGDAMKDENAIVYRIDLETPVFQMLSTRHKTALKTYEPIIDYDVYKFPNPNPKPKPKL